MKWTNKVRNEEVIRRVNFKELMLLKRILDGKRRFLDMKIEEDSSFKMIAHRKIAGKPSRGRKRLTTIS